MNPERFSGKDLMTELRAVREALGPDPLIFDTHAVSDMRGEAVEITAVAERPVATPSVTPMTIPATPAAPIPEDEGVREVRDDPAAVRSMVEWLAPNLSHKNTILQNLSSQGIDISAM